MRRPSRYLIYGLLDPDTNELRYIGKTHKRREVRLAEHLNDAKDGRQTLLAVWIRSLLAKDRTPVAFVLERVPGASDWKEAEQRHIRFWRDFEGHSFPITYPPMTRRSLPTLVSGVRLTNMTDGGDQSG